MGSALQRRLPLRLRRLGPCPSAVSASLSSLSPDLLILGGLLMLAPNSQLLAEDHSRFFL